MSYQRSSELNNKLRKTKQNVKKHYAQQSVKIIRVKSQTQSWCILTKSAKFSIWRLNEKKINGKIVNLAKC